MLKRSLFNLSVALLGTSLVLTACSSTEFPPLELTPAPLTLSAETTATQIKPIPARLLVVDQRPQQHILRLHASGEKVQFATLTEPLSSFVQQQLQPFIQAKYNQAQRKTDLTLELVIHEALCVAQESFRQHQMNCRFTLAVKAQVASDSWSKTYVASRSREGQFKLKQTFVEQDFIAISQGVLQEFLQDPIFIAWQQKHLAHLD